MHWLVQTEHTPQYENDSKETKNRPMETTPTTLITQYNEMLAFYKNTLVEI